MIIEETSPENLISVSHSSPDLRSKGFEVQMIASAIIFTLLGMAVLFHNLWVGIALVVLAFLAVSNISDPWGDPRRKVRQHQWQNSPVSIDDLEVLLSACRKAQLQGVTVPCVRGPVPELTNSELQDWCVALNEHGRNMRTKRIHSELTAFG